MANENNSRPSSLGMFSPKSPDGYNKGISASEVAQHCQDSANKASDLQEPLGKIIAMRPNQSNLDALKRVEQVITAFETTANKLNNQITEKHEQVTGDEMDVTSSRGPGF